MLPQDGKSTSQITLCSAQQARFKPYKANLLVFANGKVKVKLKSS
jgi:hypothetical protein